MPSLSPCPGRGIPSPSYPDVSKAGSGSWRRALLVVPALLAGLGLTACGPAEAPPATPDLTGTWRAVLASPGGELPFTLDVKGGSAVAINGEERAPFSDLRVDGDRVTLEIDWYDSVIDATLSPEGDRLQGEWRKTVPEGISRLPFTAVRGETDRFLPVAGSREGTPLPSVDGSWKVVFTDQDGTEPAVGQLRQEDGDPRVAGTFLTPTGDYRFLEGEYRGGVLRLSCFDGAHAFLFVARATEEGGLEGDFWSRDNYHATWTARPLESDREDPLPDPYQLARLTNQERRFHFQLPDLEGHPVSLRDERFEGKVVMVNIFGSWCPNCNDEAPVLAGWYRQYRDQGLEIVGLAFEVSGDPERDAVFVRRFAERHGIEYPLLLAGNSDKAAAANLLEDLDQVVAYPTTIYIGRDGKVRKIHSGYAGPGTGERHHELVAELEALIEELLAEPAPRGAAAAAGG